MPTNAPVITVAVADDDVTVSITGDAGATHTVYYRKTTAVGLTAATPRVGDGDVVLSDLAAGSYYVIAQSELSGVLSLPSDVAVARIVPTALTPYSVAEQTMASMLAACTTFGAECDGSPENFIFIGSDPGDTYPLALISRIGNDNSKTVGTASVVYGGQLEMLLENEIPTALLTDDAAALADFAAWVENIKKELWVESFKAGGLMISAIDISKGPGRYEEEDHKNVCAAHLAIRWGFAG